MSTYTERGYMATLVYIFCTVAILFSMVVVLFFVPNNSGQWFQFVHNLGNTCNFLIVAIVMDVVLGYILHELYFKT